MNDNESTIKGDAIVQSLTNAVNRYDEKDLVSGIARSLQCSHRTLQAGAVRVLLKALVKYAKEADIHQQTDLRNEAAVKLLLKVAPVINDNPIPFI
jgi:hypothetical protein